MAYATKKLDPFGARMLAIRLQQSKEGSKPLTVAKPGPEATDACCPEHDECDDFEALVESNQPAFVDDEVDTGCDDCGMGLSSSTQVDTDHIEMSTQMATVLNGVTNMVANLKATVGDLQTRLDTVTTRVNELEMREDTLMKSLVDSGALPGFRDLGA